MLYKNIFFSFIFLTITKAIIFIYFPFYDEINFNLCKCEGIIIIFIIDFI
jgi:hypothetical protein